ncbi:disease resistance protein RPS5-like [Magnolia sinica]|uniref:disease resistance protein RPS5-like n=1 Tax=Magnolia sinica TaxID=86752 RepID=UPI00265A4DEF|nr:disease resistance protein RPS5-like [Magnolia sinica]
MAEFIMEQIVSKVTDALISQASLEENINILRNNMNELKSRAADMMEQLNTGQVMYGKKPKGEVQLWLKNVEKKTAEMASMVQDYTERGRNFSFSHVDLGKQVQKKIRETVDLKKSGQFSDGLFADILLDSGRIPTIKLVGDRNLEKIWNSLIDLGVGILGVYGVKGVGKTTVMSHIHNMLKETSTYNCVIWVTVSSDSDLKRLQTDIAREIGLELLEEENEMRRSMKLFQALTRRTKFILILDNMQEAFRLEKIGIPKPNIDNGCKLVLVTRSLDLCIDMDCQRKLKVDILSKDDSFQLFIENLGADVEITTEVEQYARDFAENCGGFPPRIIEIARSRTKFAERGKTKSLKTRLQCGSRTSKCPSDPGFWKTKTVKSMEPKEKQ